MTALVYEEWTDRSVVRISKDPISTWEAPRVMAAWRVHADNRAYLEFMSKRGDFRERLQAARELVVCDRKMAFWKRHPNWSRVDAERHLVKLRTDWSREPPHPKKED